MIAAAHDASDASALTSARRYDDFFFVNAHGVFGFINSHRPVLSLMLVLSLCCVVLAATNTSTAAAAAADVSPSLSCAAAAGTRTIPCLPLH
jgi:hypothetical protein